MKTRKTDGKKHAFYDVRPVRECNKCDDRGYLKEPDDWCKACLRGRTMKLFAGIRATKASSATRRPKAKAAKDPRTMLASAINKELDALDVKSGKNCRAFIEAGRGHERPSEYMSKQDPLSREACAIADRESDLRREVVRRYGPGAPSRLPRGFGPLKS